MMFEESVSDVKLENRILLIFEENLNIWYKIFRENVFKLFKIQNRKSAIKSSSSKLSQIPIETSIEWTLLQIIIAETWKFTSSPHCFSRTRRLLRNCWDQSSIRLQFIKLHSCGEMVKKNRNLNERSFNIKNVYLFILSHSKFCQKKQH